MLGKRRGRRGKANRVSSLLTISGCVCKLHSSFISGKLVLPHLFHDRECMLILQATPKEREASFFFLLKVCFQLEDAVLQSTHSLTEVIDACVRR